MVTFVCSLSIILVTYANIQTEMENVMLIQIDRL